MKKNILIYFVPVVSSLFFSCNDKLDLQMDGRITMDQVFNDYNRVRGYLNSCYGYCPAPGIDRSSYTDEAQDADDAVAGSSYNLWYGGSLTASNYASYSADGGPWGSLYQGIRKCNVFLKNIKTSKAETTDDEKAGWTAQAHTLRALYYLQLAKRYGGVPIFTQPVETDHDFSKDKRSKFSDVVKLILADCDSALTAPATSTGFPWEIYENQYGIMTRAISYAIKSQAVTYAASPLWSDGTYTWANATAINKEALYQCLAHDYKLFDAAPVANAAQNAYTLYFLTSSNDLRAVDKETIYQRGGTLSVWQNAGLPISGGMNNSGQCPTQDLVDAYEMSNGEAPIKGYSDADHLNPIINADSGYDPANPYIGRDPRFYGSIYYNGAAKSLVAPVSRDDTYNLDFITTSSVTQLTISKNSAGYYDILTTGTDPHINLTPLTTALNSPPMITLSFEYMSSTGITGPQLFYGKTISAARSAFYKNIPASNDWATYTIDITAAVGSFSWGSVGDNIRFDLGGVSGASISIKNLRVHVTNIPNIVETYVGGNCEISELSRTNTRTGYYLRKFNNYKSALSNNADGAVRLFRLAELYLNFAESAYQSNGPDAVISLGGSLSMSARDAVNAIRARAGMPAFPSGMSKDAFEKKYRNERRIEFAFEEHRFFDVRRWKILDQTDKFVTGMKITKNGSLTYTRIKFTRNCSSDKYLMYPIEQSEVDKIVGLSGVNWQNPGW